MSNDNNQNQQNQQKGQQQGGGKGAASGMSVNLVVNPNDLSKPTLANGFSMLAIATLAVGALAHVAPFIRKWCFGLSDADIKAPLTKEEVVAGLNNDIKSGDMWHIGKTAMEKMKDDETRKKFIAAMGDQFNKPV